ncbi:spore coat protein [Metabacillus sp. GX 13764]|uniref:CotD family spore coat protein n=1 Tax=Metabacillus kandeliae TaxID=2900151 RepID=UPI001E347E07|nr:CotD family spore coat protein [Metabacillus kandeliae]MCD7033416.1 spore coat protein [Metabacillus kandeliae]
MMGPQNAVPPVVHPTQNAVVNSYSTTIVPHIHPQHVTNVNHQMFKHLHYHPQTQSCCNEVSHQHFNCPGPGPFFR